MPDWKNNQEDVSKTDQNRVSDLRGSSDLNHVEIDSISRRRIVSEINQNFFVEAGAGSGKTTMLVNRMVAMVEAGIDISKICAITFTKAAAGEFYNRFQKLLSERANPDYIWKDTGHDGQLPAPTEESRRHCQEALKNIDLCFMGTIDSFCGMVLSEHPSEAKIPSDAAILSDADVQALYKQIYVEICSGVHGERLQALSKHFRTVHRNPEEVFVSGMAFFMDHRNAEFHYIEEEDGDINRFFKEEQKEIRKALNLLLDHEELKYPKENNNLKAWEILPDTVRTINRDWNNSFSSVMWALKSLKAIRLLPVALERYEYELAPVFEPGGAKGAWLEFLPAKEGGFLSRMQGLQYNISMTFLNACIPVIEKIMRDNGSMTFFDYLFYLRNMLKEDAAGEGKLISYIYDRHSYFLIDEFQDTNPMQAEVFFYLSAKEPKERWSDCVPRPGSLFIVGDPKQSIYRFRSADIASFLRVKELFVGELGDVLYLSKNFRSRKSLCSYFNTVFEKMMPEQTAVQSKFESIPLQEDEGAEFEGIFTYNAYTGKAEVQFPEETDTVQIRKIIEKLVDQEAYKISLHGGAPRPIQYGDIMVITYGKKKIDGIMKALEAAEIPIHVEGRVPFDRNAALQEVCKIYGAIAEPGDYLASYRALTGSLMGYSDAEIVRYRQESGSKVSVDSAVDVGSKNEEKVLTDSVIDLGSLKELAGQAKKLSPAALFSKILDTLEVYKKLPAESLEVVYYTLELLRNAERTGEIVSLKDGADFLNTLVEGGSEEERCLKLNEEENCVHIANLHKVKGLEAPVVILSAALQFSSSVTSRMIYSEERAEGYLFELDGERNENGRASIYFSTDQFPDEKWDEKETLNAERHRLIYVAATRARNALIICNSVAILRGKEVKKSIWMSLMEEQGLDIFETLKDVVPAERSEKARFLADDLYEKARQESVLNDRRAEDAGYEVKRPSHAHVPSILEAEDEGEGYAYVNKDFGTDGVMDSISDDASGDGSGNTCEQEKEVSEVHRFPALLGTMTHRLMEVIVTTKDQADMDDTIQEILIEYLTPDAKDLEKQLEEALKKVVQTIHSGGYPQTNGLPSDILAELLQAEECYCEVPFCYRDEEAEQATIWNGIMDVVYKKNGHWQIVDYKTNMDGTDLDARYQAQLEAYKKAFKSITGEEVQEARTYHIDI